MKSPRPPKNKIKDLDFYEALKQIMEGHSISKREWGNKDIHGLLRDGRLTLHKADNQYYDWILTDGDIYGEDFFRL